MKFPRFRISLSLFVSLAFSAWMSTPLYANELQVQVEAKIVETSQNFNRDLGVNFHHGDQIGGQLQDMEAARNLDNPGLGLGSPLPATGAAGFGDNVGVMIQALQSENSNRIIQAPKLVALDNQEATIFVGETVRYAKANATPAQTGFQLLVIPHVIPSEGRVIMQLNTAPTGGFPSITLPELDLRVLRTQVITMAGPTAVIGGLIRESEVSREDKIPFFGNIPYISQLFKSTGESETKRNLLVFVTPRIIQPAD